MLLVPRVAPCLLDSTAEMHGLSLSKLVSLLVPVTILGVAPTGCSFLFVTEAPPNHQKLPYFDCTSSRALPVIDTVLAAAYGLGGIGVLSSGSNSGSTYSPATTMLPFLALAGGLTASAVVGYRETTTCRDAKSELMQRLVQRDSASPPWAPNAPVAVDPWLHPGPEMGGTAKPSEMPPPYPAPPAQGKSGATKVIPEGGAADQTDGGEQ